VTVTVKSISSGGGATFRGDTEQVLAQLLLRYPWARRPRSPGDTHDPGSLRDVLARIAGAQDLVVDVAEQ
jgi:hypothetical protein